MKGLIGLILLIVGIGIGLYVGIYICFIGGISQIVGEIRADDMSNAGLAWGIAKTWFSGLAGLLADGVFVFPGWILLQTS